jgi:hypothetical protein
MRGGTRGSRLTDKWRKEREDEQREVDAIVISVTRGVLRELFEAADRSPWHGRSEGFNIAMRAASVLLGLDRVGY